MGVVNYISIFVLPGLSLKNLDELLHAALKPIKHRWPDRLTIEELYPPIPCFEYPINHNMVKIIENLLDKKAQTVNYLHRSALYSNAMSNINIKARFDRAGSPT